METTRPPNKYSFTRVTPPKEVVVPADPQTPPPAKAAEAAQPAQNPPAPAPQKAHVPSISGTALATLVPSTESAPYERRRATSYGDDSEGLTAKDIIMPRLNLVQKVGDLSNEFTEGDLLFKGETVILPSPKVDKSGRCIKIIVAGFRKDRFAEKTLNGVKGNIFDTEEEVFNKGGTTDYNEAKATKKPLYQTLAECLILIEKPEWIDDSSFKHFANGKAYAPALWAQKGTAFTNATKYLRTARKAGWLADVYNPDGSLKEKRSYAHGAWELRTELKEYFGNFSWIPVLRRGEYTTPEVQTLAASLLG